MAYRPDIDGLRAVAVGGVVLYHLTPSGAAPLLPGGFLGVDVFFVISGFLITAILWREIAATGRVDFWAFYARRARRILPALLAMLAAVLVVGALILPPRALDTSSLSAAAAAVFAANFHFKDTVGYFDPPAAAQPLLHTWSLAVEEQFYLIWPVLLLALVAAPRIGPWITARPSRALWPLGALCLASLALAEAQAATRPLDAFYLLPARLWELGIGGLIAIAAPMIAARLTLAGREMCAALGLALVIGAMLLQSDLGRFPGFAAAPACLGAALVIISGLPAAGGGAAPLPVAAWLLRTPPMIGLGLVSYALYLWHWPVIVLAEVAAPGPRGLAETAGLGALALALAALSTWGLERPIRRARGWGDRRSVGLGVASVVAVALAALAGHLSGGWPGRAPEAARAYEAAAEPPSPAIRCGVGPFACAFGAEAGPEGPDILLFGDSHADNLTPALATIAEARGLSGLRVRQPLCVPLFGVEIARKGGLADCAGVRAAMLETLSAASGARAVIFVGRWSNLTAEPGLDGRPTDAASAKLLLRDGESGARSQADARRVLEAGLARMAFEALAAAPEARVIFVKQTPDHLGDPAGCGVAAMWRGDDPVAACAVPAARMRERAAFSDAVIDRLAAHPRVAALDGKAPFCASDACANASASGPLYYDETHLTEAGAARLAPALRAALP